ncbi:MULTISPECIES: hypothetical protein [unclassified Streptomyces]|uniref:hypothetical protein n=1 Tax=unclassified Streptomyces TaxID=2593676 RepID=UPI00352EF81B
MDLGLVRQALLTRWAHQPTKDGLPLLRAVLGFTRQRPDVLYADRGYDHNI